jgi:hypothetical protein
MKTKIYLVSNIDNDPNRIYIGKTKNSRKADHMKTYGLYITYDYIDEINSLSKEDWEPLESYWIEQFKQWGFNVVNKNKGGGGVEYHTKETKKKMSKPKPNNIKQKIKNTLTGNKHIEHKRGKEHGNYGKTKSQEHIQNMSKPKPIGFGLKVNFPRPNVSLAKSKPIIQYDKNNNIIQEWPNAVKASEILNIKVASICNVLKNRAKTAGGFIWKYKEN